MKKLILIFIFFFSFISVFSLDTNKNIYSGGMLILQPGYLITKNDYQSINHSNFGIGGILKFYPYKYLTIGIYGGSQKTHYPSSNSQNSYINIGYGGPFVGFSIKPNKIRYTISAFVGKTTIRNLHINSQNNVVLSDAYLYKHSSLIYTPILSIDYPISKRIVLTLQTVCLTTKIANESLYNPIMQFGILFNR